MPITREEVLHVAKLARLELTDDEVERLTGELSAILEAVSKVSELDLSDVPPTSHPLELVNGWGADEPHESLSLDEVFANAPRREGDLFKVPADDVTAASTRCASPPRRRSACSSGRRSPAPSSTAPTSTPSRERDHELHCYLRTVDEPAGRRRPDRAQGRDLDRGRRDDGRLEDPRGLRARLRRDRRGALQGGGPAAARQDEHRRVRDGLVDRELGLRAVAQPVGPDARPRRLGRRHRGRGLGRPRAVGLGSDTGGSIKQPSALCGNVGLRPTYGTVSRYGVVAFASSLDQVGPVAKNVRDCARLYSIIAGRDPDDSTTVDVPAVELPEGESLKGLRIGVPKEMNETEGIEPGVTSRRAEGDRAGAGARRRGGGVRAAALGRVRPRLLLPDRARPRPPRTSPATTASATASASMRTATTRWSSARATRASATSRSAGSCSARTRSRPATTRPTTARRRRCER